MLDADVVRKMLNEIRDGATLRQVCAPKGRPSRLQWYDWLREDAQLGDESLADAYHRALEDQAASWEDDVIEAMVSYNVIGRREDGGNLKKMEVLGRAKIALAKERRRKGVRGSGGSVNVVLSHFGENDDED